MLKQLLRLPLASKCGLIAALICGIAGLTLLITSMTASKQILLETTRLIGQQWTNQLASQSQQALLRNDRVSLQAILQDYIESPLIVYGSIQNARGEAVAEAGTWRDDHLNYQSAVAADGRLGQVKLSLSSELIGNEIRDLGKTLLLLTAILCCLSYALIAVPMLGIERHLDRARARLAQPIKDDESLYPGQDALGELLNEIHNPQIRLMQAGEKRYRDYYILHCHWQAYDDLKEKMTAERFEQQLQTAFARSEAIARLYHGELILTRHNAVTLRFFQLDGCDAPLFRALCAAELLHKLDRSLKIRPGIARVCSEGSDWHCQADECAAIDRLHTTTAEGEGIWLDNNCCNHERLDAWASCRGNRVGSLKSPYNELLERQHSQLKSLDLEHLQRRPNDGATAPH
jgi:hypothetical protein